MELETTRLLRVIDDSSGRRIVEENITPQPVAIDEKRVPYPRDRRGRMTVNPELIESSTGQLSTANFPDLLRMGVTFDVFSSYNEAPVTYPQFVQMRDSNKQQEEYLKDSALGIAPVVPEGGQYPEAPVQLGEGLTIRNYKRGYLIPVTEEMQRFDQLGKVRDLSNSIGRSLRLTEEQAVMDVLTTTGNYTRTNAAGDNDETATGGGANQQTLTFSPVGFVAAMNILGTMKDRKTGVRLGVIPDTLIIGPKLLWFARQMLMSPGILPVGDPGSAATTYGGGTTNPFYMAIRNIIVSPYFGSGSSSYNWCLMEARRAVTFQRVDPLQVLTEGMNPSVTEYMERDTIRYRARTWFGVGMKDDRFAFYSNSTTQPIID